MATETKQSANNTRGNRRFMTPILSPGVGHLRTQSLATFLRAFSFQVSILRHSVLRPSLSFVPAAARRNRVRLPSTPLGSVRFQHSAFALNLRPQMAA